MGGARVNDFYLTKNPNLKKEKKIFFFLRGGGGGGGGARVSNFFTKNPNLKRKIALFFAGGEEARVNDFLLRN